MVWPEPSVRCTWPSLEPSSWTAASESILAVAAWEKSHVTQS